MNHRDEKPENEEQPVALQDVSSFPVVGVGASAGGLESFVQLLRSLPPDSGMAFILIQHLDPSHPSYLSEALARSTSVPVTQIHDGMLVEPNHIYVTPSNADVGIIRGTLTLLPRPTKEPKPHLPIDFFFAALAADRGNQAIGVVLSGTGSDGTAGLRAIKAEGGVTFAQDPGSAKFSGMPESAIKAGVVDLALPLPELADELTRIGHHPLLLGQEIDVLAAPADDLDLKKVLVLVRSAVGIDFSEYKLPSIRRRLARRMALHKLTTLREYVQLLRDDRTEPQALFEDILIHVTSFFRDGAALDKLKEVVFPEILKQKREGGTIRIWVTGCSTGEEAYSLLIALFEFLAQENASDVPIQLFATDVSEKAIEKARAGLYPESAVRDLGEGRLARFFTKAEGGGYRINKALRERCAFVKHDLASDPPFSKLDLVSCRNLLIYFGPELQRRVLTTFQFALNQPGFLLLGHAENIFDGSNLFTAVDREHKIFARTTGKSTLRIAPAREAVPMASRPVVTTVQAASSAELIRRTESLLLDQYAPPGVIVNERMEILHFRGRTGPYLEPTPGQPEHNLLKMARKGLMAELRIALSQAKKEGTLVRRPGVRVEEDGSERVCDVVVVPIVFHPEAREAVFAVLFEEVHPVKGAIEGTDLAEATRPELSAADQQHLGKLENELKATKEYLQSVIEDHQHTNEELMTANEELVSTNEELQSLNEELETAKEELQSTNEELATLNEELQTRNSELNSLNSDLLNILGSVEVPIVIVDSARRIRRFTPKARPILNLLPSDIGRPIDDIKPTIMIESLDQKIMDVIDTVTMREEEVQGKDGRWYRLQIRPYTTVDKRIDGAVLSVVDIDVLKRALGAAEWARDYAIATVKAVQTPLLLLDAKLRVLSANEAFYDRYRPLELAFEGKDLFEIMNGAWNTPMLRSALQHVLLANERFQRLEIDQEIRNLGKRSLSVSARTVTAPSGEPMVLLTVEDITDRLQQEADRAQLLADTKAAKVSAEEANRTKDLFLATLSHELRTPLAVLVMQAEILRRGETDPKKIQRVGAAIARAAATQAQLIADLLDISRIVAGKLNMEIEAVSLASVVQTAIENVAPTALEKKLDIQVQVDESLSPVAGDPMRLQQVVVNLLTNAIKFTPEEGQIRVVVDAADRGGRVRVADTGVGIDPDFLRHIFNRFSQEDHEQTRAFGGLGLGLAISRYLIEAHGGEIRAESPGKGKGATFTILVPFMKSHGRLAQGPAVTQLPEADIKGVRVLVVEDDQGTREALTDLLALSGAKVEAAELAAQAIRVFEGFRPQLVICDVAMPGEDGYSFISRIRALGRERGGDVPALALTALAGEDDRRRALAAGFSGHLAKPVDIDRLVRALADLLSAAGQVKAPEHTKGL